MNYYKTLRQYFKNGCKLHQDSPPVMGEAGYKNYMLEQITAAGINPGDEITVEEKVPHRGTNRYTGMVLQINDLRIRMLSQGTKVWKNKSNVKDVTIEYITNIHKEKNAKPDFDIQQADPFYVPETKESLKAQKCAMQETQKERTKEFKREMIVNFPEEYNQDKKVLWLLFDFYWNYGNGSVDDAKIQIVNIDDSIVPLPEYDIRQIYPNKGYYSTCSVKSTDKQNGGLLLFFDSLEELRKIRFISCIWTVDIDGEKTQFLSVVYPEFKDGGNGVYNVWVNSTTMQVYETSLHKYTVFSEMLEKDFACAFLYRKKGNEPITPIMSEPTETERLDTGLCAHVKATDKVSKKYDTEADKIEVLVKNMEVEPYGYVWQWI